MAPLRITREELQKYDTFLFDADGVLWTGDRPIPGAVEFISYLLEKGKRVFIITNNSTKTRTEYMKKIQKIGFGQIAETNIISPAIVLAAHLRDEGYSGKKVYLIGTSSLKNSLEEGAGVKCFGVGPDNFADHSNTDFLFNVKTEDDVAAVVVSFDGHISYPKIMRAANYIKDKDVGYFITNEDYTFPGPDKSIVVPGTGVVAAAVRVVSDREPVVFGKPHRAIGDFLKKHHHIEPTKTIMFGDRLDTDIQFANSNGFASCLMLTGVHSLDTVEKAVQKERNDLIPLFTFSFA